MPITSDFSGAGAISRIIEISCGKERLLSDYRGLSDTLSHNWGFAGKEFVEGLTPQVLEAAKKVQEEYRAAFEASATTEKLALSASLILTADALAELLIWHTGTSLSAVELAQYPPPKREDDTNQLSRIMPEAGFNATAFRQWAATEGYLRRDAEGKSTFMVRLHGKPPTRCVWLYLDGK